MTEFEIGDIVKFEGEVKRIADNIVLLVTGNNPDLQTWVAKDCLELVQKKPFKPKVGDRVVWDEYVSGEYIVKLVDDEYVLIVCNGGAFVQGGKIANFKNLRLYVPGW